LHIVGFPDNQESTTGKS